MTEQFYTEKIQNILATNGGLPGPTNLVVNTKLEAKQSIQRITLICKELRLVKKEIHQEIDQLKLGFAAERSTIGHDLTSNLEGFIFGTRTEGHFNAERRAQVRNKLAAAVNPYERLKLRIDEIIGQLDIAKERIKLMTFTS